VDISAFPVGLLELLGSGTRGKTPNVANDQIQIVTDAERFYSTRLREWISADIGAVSSGITFFGPTVPLNEVWIIRAGGLILECQDTGEVLGICWGITPPDMDPAVPTIFPLSNSVDVSVPITGETQLRCAPLVLPGLILTPGTGFAVQASILTGATLNLTRLRILVDRLTTA